MLKKSTPATTPKEMAMVLSTLPLDLRWKFLLDELKKGSAPWIDAARENGMFNVAGKTDAVFGSKEPLRMIEAAIGFIQQFTYGDTRRDPVFGDLPAVYNVPLFEGSPELCAAFARLADHYIEEESHLQALRSKGDHVPCIANHFARLLAGAAVLDLPECVRRLAQSCPDAVSEPVPYALLGPNPKSVTNSNVWPTPFGLALMFSRPACLDAMALHASNKRLPIGIEIHGHLGAHQEASFDRYFHLKDQYCLPGAFTKALQHALAGPIQDHQRKACVDMAMSAMDDSLKNYCLLRPAFLAAGLYDIDPAKSVANALMNGREEIIRHLKGRIPWGEVGFTRSEKNSPMVQCLMEAQMNVREKEYENAMLAVIELAEADGKLDLVLHQFVQLDAPRYPIGENWWGPVSVEPLVRIIGMGFDRVLLKYLERGLDPNTPAGTGAWTPQKIADATPTGASAVMRSYVARERSRALINEIDDFSVPTEVRP